MSPKVMIPPAGDNDVEVPKPSARQGKTVDPNTEICACLEQMDAWMKQCKRAYAGFNALYTAWLSHEGRLPPGERQKGLPIFEFSAPLIGAETREAVKCVIDLRHIAPEHVAHVLVPMITTTAGELHGAVAELENLFAALRAPMKAITAVVGTTQE